VNLVCDVSRHHPDAGLPNSALSPWFCVTANRIERVFNQSRANIVVAVAVMV
jgi:hypothetical protein